MQKIVNPRFVAPPEKNPESLEYPDEYKRELKSFEVIHLKHELSDEGKRRIRHWINRAEYPELTHTTLCRVFRVKIKPGQFELEDGTVAPPEKTPSQVIVASFSEYTDNPDYIKKGGQTKLDILSGEFCTKYRYSKHLAKFIYDQRGNITDSQAMGSKYMYTKAYSPEVIRELLDNYEHDKTLSFACAIANDGIGADPYVGTPKTIKNLKEFIEIEDIDGLIASNIGTKEYGSFLGEDYGGYNRYLKYKAQKEKEGAATALTASSPPSGTTAADTSNKRQITTKNKNANSS